MNANTDVGQPLAAMFRLPRGCLSCVKLSSEGCTVVTEFTYTKSSFCESKKSQTSISIKGIKKRAESGLVYCTLLKLVPLRSWNPVPKLNRF